MRFSHRRLFIFDIATLTKHCILRYESYFYISCGFAFFVKNRRKTCSKIETTFFLSKITKKSSPGTRFGTQSCPELTLERSKNPKTMKTSSFWIEQFFERSTGREKGARTPAGPTFLKSGRHPQTIDLLKDGISSYLSIYLSIYQEFTVALIRVTSSSRFFELFSTLFVCFRLFLTCKIDPKIDAKSYPEGAWGDLRGLPEASRRPPGLVFGRNSP